MSKIVQRWRKAVKGCVNKSTKETLIDNDYLQPILTNDEFSFRDKENQTHLNNLSALDNKFHVYNDYDNLDHQTLPKHLKSKGLKESTNTTLVKGFRRVFTSKSLDKETNLFKQDSTDENNNLGFDGLIRKNDNMLTFKELRSTSSKNILDCDELNYCEIPDSLNILADNKPLIDFKSNQNKSDSTRFETSFNNKIKSSDSKINLFTRFENEDHTNEENNQIPHSQSLNEMRELDSFVSQSEAFHWYLNLIFETKTKCVKNDQNLNENDRAKRLSICMAHLLYARNFYEMRISNSPKIKSQLANVHPCLIALACLLDSDAVRIVDSHSCTCDSYVYLFSTRLKFCAWKSKLYIILKRPKRSSIDRLTLIEDLTNCHKIIQDKA